MTREEWHRVKALFHGALDIPAAGRQAWLAREAGADDPLRREVEDLLAAHEAAGDFLEDTLTVRPADLVEDAEAPFTTPFTSLPPGTRIGPYEIEREMARGGMGVVYRARDLRLDRAVALKAVTSVREGDTAARERLRREARAAATISHPAVATVYAIEEFDGHWFIASEFIEGETLRSEIELGPLSRQRALVIAGNIARGLIAMHDAGVVHRDLKPDNIMITTGDVVKVVDFGIAWVEGVDATRITQPGVAVGTPAYMSPEQLRGAAVDARSDIYSLGVVLAEMLAGHHPRTLPASSHPSSAAAVIGRCLQPDPDQRYQSARELLAAIEQELAGGQVAAGDSRWWWQFHQLAATLVYGIMMWPAWMARGIIGGAAGNFVFIAIMVTAIVGAIMRLHLWFSSRFYLDELAWARARATRWIAITDLTFSVASIVGGILVGDSRAALAITLIAVGVGVAVALLIVEPATARAAFRRHAAL